MVGKSTHLLGLCASGLSATGDAPAWAPEAICCSDVASEGVGLGLLSRYCDTRRLLLPLRLAGRASKSSRVKSCCGKRQVCV
jgi:hypothetical protein